MKETKTVKQWLETLPEPYRSEALRNMDVRDADIIRTSLPHAVAAAFAWNASKQGGKYWSDICDRAEAGEFTPEPTVNELEYYKARCEAAEKLLQFKLTQEEIEPDSEEVEMLMAWQELKNKEK